MIYLVRMGASGPVKIGIAANPRLRIAAIQRGVPEKMTVIQIVEGGRAGERVLHKRFSALRLRGEWFTYCDEMTHDFGDLTNIQLLGPAASRLISEKTRQPLNDSPAQRIALRFGGQNAMARALGIAQSTIWGWTRAGHIPPKRRAAVRAAALKLTPPLILPRNFEDIEEEPPVTTVAA